MISLFTSIFDSYSSSSIHVVCCPTTRKSLVLVLVDTGTGTIPAPNELLGARDSSSVKRYSIHPPGVAAQIISPLHNYRHANFFGIIPKNGHRHVPFGRPPFHMDSTHNHPYQSISSNHRGVMIYGTVLQQMAAP